MPFAVIPQSNPLQDITVAATGTLQGLTQGEQYNEQVRQQHEAADTQRRQFADEMAFKVHNLKVMQQEGLLNREQETRLKKMEEDWGSAENELGRQQETRENAKKLSEQHYESDEQNKTTRIGDIRQQQAANYATKTTGEYQQTNLAQQGMQQRNAIEHQSVGNLITTYGDSIKTDPRVREEAFQKHLRTIYPAEQLDGAKNVIQIPQATINQERGKFAQYVQNYDNEQNRLLNDTEGAALAQSRGNAVGQNSRVTKYTPPGTAALVSGGPQGAPVTVKSLQVRGSEPNPLTGSQPLNKALFPHDVAVELNNIDIMIPDVMHDLTLNTNANAQKNVAASLWADVQYRIQGMNVDEQTKSALSTYYQTAIMAAAQQSASSGSQIVGE